MYILHLTGTLSFASSCSTLSLQRVVEEVVLLWIWVKLVALCVPEQLLLHCVSLPLPLAASSRLEHSFAGALQKTELC